jgi:hypothetical protein
MKELLFILVLLHMGCAELQNSLPFLESHTTVPVTVTTYVNDEFRNIFRKSKFCFLAEEKQESDPTLFAENRRREAFVELCTESGLAKKVKIEKDCDDSTIAIDLQYFAKTNESKVDGTSGSCTTLYGSVICSSRSYTHVSVSGSKLIVMQFNKWNGDSWKVVGQAESFLLTETPGIRRGTIVAACRSIFSILPQEVEFENVEARVDND